MFDIQRLSIASTAWLGMVIPSGHRWKQPSWRSYGPSPGGYPVGQPAALTGHRHSPKGIVDKHQRIELSERFLSQSLAIGRLSVSLFDWPEGLSRMWWCHWLLPHCGCLRLTKTTYIANLWAIGTSNRYWILAMNHFNQLFLMPIVYRVISQPGLKAAMAWIVQLVKLIN